MQSPTTCNEDHYLIVILNLWQKRDSLSFNKRNMRRPLTLSSILMIWSTRWLPKVVANHIAGVVWFNWSFGFSQSYVPIASKHWIMASLTCPPTQQRFSSEAQIMYTHKMPLLCNLGKALFFQWYSQAITSVFSSPGRILLWSILREI